MVLDDQSSLSFQPSDTFWRWKSNIKLKKNEHKIDENYETLICKEGRKSKKKLEHTTKNEHEENKFEDKNRK